jgi:hypothetical protein
MVMTVNKWKFWKETKICFWPGLQLFGSTVVRHSTTIVEIEGSDPASNTRVGILIKILFLMQS